MCFSAFEFGVWRSNSGPNIRRHSIFISRDQRPCRFPPEIFMQTAHACSSSKSEFPAAAVGMTTLDNWQRKTLEIKVCRLEAAIARQGDHFLGRRAGTRKVRKRGGAKEFCFLPRLISTFGTSHVHDVQ